MNFARFPLVEYQLCQVCTCRHFLFLFLEYRQQWGLDGCYFSQIRSFDISRKIGKNSKYLPHTVIADS